MRESVLLRDGMKCVCCCGRNLLMAHHVDFRSNGGRTVPSQLCCLCADCHEMVHEGVLFVSGDARRGLTFEDRDGVPHVRAIRAGGGKVRVVKSQDVNSLALDDSVCAENGSEDGSAFPRVPLKAPARFAPPVSFDSLSEVVDATWWGENKGRFQWNEKRRALEVVPGVEDGKAVAAPHVRPDDGITGPSLAELIGHEDVVACQPGLFTRATC